MSRFEQMDAFERTELHAQLRGVWEAQLTRAGFSLTNRPTAGIASVYQWTHPKSGWYLFGEQWSPERLAEAAEERVTWRHGGTHTDHTVAHIRRLREAVRRMANVQALDWMPTVIKVAAHDLPTTGRLFAFETLQEEVYAPFLAAAPSIANFSDD